LNSTRQLWMLVGGNGAGKSTFYERYLKPLGLPLVNADILARLAYPEAPEAHSYDAARMAGRIRDRLLASGASFCFETVYSHPSKVDFVARAKAHGYEVVLVVIHLQHVELNQARVAERVATGGHGVPEEKVASRIPRTLNHVKASIALCDWVRVYDNSLLDDPFRPVFSITHGRIRQHCNPLPDWAEALLSG